MQVLETHNYVCEHGFIHHNSGKTEVMANKAMMDSIEAGAGSLVALYEPTYDLVKLVIAPRMEQKLDEWGIGYTHNKSDHIIYTSSGQFGDFIMRTLDNPARIIAYESYRSHIDELDTLPLEKAREAWNKIIARNRQIPDRIQNPINKCSVYTTPEGFRFVYERWHKAKNEDYGMVQASTTSNPFLPDGYVDSLRSTYDDRLVEAYINGQFVNLVAGSVYHDFDRDLNKSTETVQPRDVLHVGMDFNVQKMSAVFHVKRNGEPHAVDEIMGAFDTPDLINKIDAAFPGHQIIVYPDSSGKNRKSVGANQTDITLLKDAGYKVKAKTANPPVRARINSVNAMICNGEGLRRYMVNSDKCPITCESLEQQIYNKQGEPDKAHDTDHPCDAVGYLLHYEYPIIRTVSRDISWQ